MRIDTLSSPLCSTNLFLLNWVDTYIFSCEHHLSFPTCKVCLSKHADTLREFNLEILDMYANVKTFHRQLGTLGEFDSEIPNMYESAQNLHSFHTSFEMFAFKWWLCHLRYKEKCPKCWWYTYSSLRNLNVNVSCTMASSKYWNVEKYGLWSAENAETWKKYGLSSAENAEIWWPGARSSRVTE